MQIHFLAGTSVPALIIAALVAPVPAFAQQAMSAPIALDQAPPSDIAAEPTGIVDIVVTAQRRSENLQRAALAVTAVDGDTLAKAGVFQPQDLAKLVPALKLSAIGGSGTQVTIRGIGNLAGNPYAEPAVAINLDGVYLARSGGPNGLFYDLERVEVLKGPQGTLYGRNATAGAINVVTRKPTDVLSAQGSVEVGNYDLRRGQLALNVPIASGAALRVAGVISRRDGYLDDGYMDDRTEAARAQLRLEPTSALSILLSADYAHLGGKGPTGVIAPYLNPNNPFAGPTRDGTNDFLRQVSLGFSGGSNPGLLPPVRDDGFVDQTNWGLGATIDYDFGGAKLTVLPAYRRSSNDYLMYNTAFPTQSRERSEATSVEARLSSTGTSPFQWLLGGYFFNEDITFRLFANQGIGFNRTEPNLNTRSYAAFSQVSYALSDTFRLTGGLRYTNEQKTQEGRNGGPPPPVPSTFPGDPAAFYALACQPYDASNGSCFFPLQGDLEKSKVTWKAGFELDAAPRSLVYGNVATGFKAGGFFGSLAPNTYKPEELTAYTLGTKNRFLGNTLQLNVEAFFWSYKDKQVTHIGPILPGGFDLITENAGNAEIYGLETELIWQPTRDDTLSANVQYLHSKYTEFRYTQTTLTGPPYTTCDVTPGTGTNSVTVDCSGRRLPLSPTWTANLAYQHTVRFDSGASLDAQVGTQIQSFYFVGDEYAVGERQRGTMVSNATLTWRAPKDHYSIGVFVDNIEDRTVKVFGFGNGIIRRPLVNLRAPRTFGARINFNL